jgi:hypothetical protein
MSGHILPGQVILLIRTEKLKLRGEGYVWSLRKKQFTP